RAAAASAGPPAGPRGASAPAREGADKLRKLAAAAREAATRLEAERLAPGLWAPALAKEREADAALGRQDFAKAQAAYGEAQAGYEQAAARAEQAVALVAKEFEARKAQETMRQARQAAERIEASKLAPPLWAKASGIERDA